MISIIIPTVDGRESDLIRCRAAYEQRTIIEHEIIVIENLSSCGEAWQVGVEMAVGDYIHFSADDLEPHDRWCLDAVKAADDGGLPAPTIYGPKGGVEHLGSETDGCTRIPFCTREQWLNIDPMLPIHYYTDNWFSARGVQAGYPIIEVPTYRFTHHWAMAGRYGGQKMMDDKMAYRMACIEYGTPPIP
jgi:hypothetical protein